MTTTVKVLVPLIDNGILYLPGETIELDEALIEQGTAQQLYERVNDEPLQAHDGETNNG